MKELDREKYEAIICVARCEFLLRSYKEVSMRDIAQKSNVGLSNLYNYFKNKDEIFCLVLKPAKDALYSFIDSHHSEETADMEQITSLAYFEKISDSYIDLIYQYKDEFQLLFFGTDGSSLANLRDDFTNHITQVSLNHMKIIKKRYPQVQEISEFFTHTLSSWMVTILGEIVSHRLSKTKARDFFKELFRFQIAGWCELMKKA